MSDPNQQVTSEDKLVHLKGDFVLESGETLQSPEAAYHEYGNAEGPVILMSHGGFSSHRAVEWWGDLIGPGKAFNTDTYRIICVNFLGSTFGTTSALTNGKGFPKATMVDLAHFQMRVADALGIDKVFLAAGPSMGGLLSLNLAALYPDRVGGVFASATSARMTPSGTAFHQFLIDTIKGDPAFKDGDYEKGEMDHVLRAMARIGRIYYTHEDLLVTLGQADTQMEQWEKITAYLSQDLDEKVGYGDANCYLTILHAVNTFDLGVGHSSLEEGIRRIKCPVLTINFNSDIEFAPRWADQLAQALNEKSPGQATAVALDSPFGHMACVLDGAKMNQTIQEFLELKMTEVVDVPKHASEATRTDLS